MWTSFKRSVAFWFGLTLFVAGLVILPFALQARKTHNALLTRGKATEAAVVDQGELKQENGHASQWLKLQYYDIEMKEYSRDQAVSREFWEQHPVGTTVRVRYLREAPETVSLEATLNNPEWKDLFAMAVGFTGIGIIIMAVGMALTKRRAANI